MERIKSMPVDWVGKPSYGIVVNAAFSDENTQTLLNWLMGLQAVAADGIAAPKPDALHITLLDWIAPLLPYGGQDKRELYLELRPVFGPVLKKIIADTAPIDVHFDEIQVKPDAIILVGHDAGQFRDIRELFMDSVTLPVGGKEPPVIIHSSLVRFVPPAIDLGSVQSYASAHPLDLKQHITEFRLIETVREPLQEYRVLDTYQLHQAL